MRLIVVRHAIAGVRDPRIWLNDGERPLTKKGRIRFARAAEGLARLVPEVDLMLSSPYVRAWDTAMLLKEHGGWPAPQICDELKDGSPEVVLQALQPYRSLDSVAMVGHEPYLSRFISQVLSPAAGVTMELKKGAAACIDLPQTETHTDSRLLWLLQPRALRGLA